MPVHGDFDLRAVYDALDARRRERQISWTVVASEVNRFRTRLRPIAVSTITSLRTKPKGEGDGILQMLLWLGRTPESFVPGVADVARSCAGTHGRCSAPLTQNVRNAS